MEILKEKRPTFFAGVATVSNNKKKRDDKDSHTVVLRSEDSIKLTDSNETEKQKTKEKRKCKKTSDPVIQAEQVSSDVVKKPVDNEVSDPQLHEPGKKQKDKKKKKGKLDSESLVVQATETMVVNGNGISLEDKSVIVKGKTKKKGDSVSKSSCGNSKEDTADKDKKSYKEGRRSTSEENNSEPTDKKRLMNSNVGRWKVQINAREAVRLQS